MFNLFKKKNKIKELETRISALEANVTYLKQQDEVTRKDLFRKSFVVSGDFKCRICNLDGKVVGNSKVNGDLILQIDGDTIGKIALNQLKKMQRQGNIKLNCV